MLSPLARTISSPFTTGQTRPIPVFGVGIHTTGSGLPAAAIAAGQDPFDYAINYYRGSKGPTYVVGWKPGQLAAVAADESVRTWHIGVEADEKVPLQTGTWRQRVSPETVRQWDRVHGAGKNPLSKDGTTRASLIPTTDPNNSTIGIEMIPVTPGGTTFWDRPRPGTRFTEWQHTIVAELVADIAKRHGWPPDWRQTRVFGHEDLNPIRRQDAGGGWDPGRLRAKPYVDFERIRLGPVGPLALIAAALLVAYAIHSRRR